MTEITQTLLAGLIPLAGVAAVLLAFHVRYPLVRRIALPLLLATFATGVAVANALGLGDPEQGAVVLRATLWVLGLVLALRALTYYAFGVLLERQWRVSVPPLLPRVTRAILYVAAVFAVLSVAFPTARVGPLLATSAVTSLVLGLALQPILTNFFAGVVIALERPFRIDDWIQIGDLEGRVTSITWRTTAVRTRENDTIIFPNANVSQETVTNFLYPHPLHMAKIYVGVHYRTPPHEARAAILLAASRVQGILDQPTAEVYVHDFGDSAIQYELRAWTEDMAALRRIESDARQEIWEELHRRGLVIPFPIRTLEITRPRRGERAHDEPSPGRLFVTAGASAGALAPIGGEAVVVGRGADCDLRIDEPAASKRHFRVVWKDGDYRLEDLESTHGTEVNGERVAEIELDDLDRIRVGDTRIVIEIEHADT